MSNAVCMTKSHSEPTSDMAAPKRTARKRISFLINSMEGGGAERAMANLLTHLLPHLKDYEVELILLDDLPHEQSLPSDLKVVTLNGKGSMLRSARELRRYWARPETRPVVCVSYLARSNVLNVLLSRMSGHGTIISERVHTSSHIAGSRAKALLAWITRKTYPRANHVIAVGEGVADDLNQNFSVPRARMSVIGNPIDGPRLRNLAQEQPCIALPDDYVLGVGRLVPNKNFDLVIRAYAQAQIDPSLVLLGQGPEEQALRSRVAEFGLEDRVIFAGFVKNPYPFMSRARALVSGSRAEGFPNTLIEAMAVGCPVIATDCPSGPATVLASAPACEPPWPDTAYGLLVPMEDANAMSAALRVMCDSDRRTEYARLASKRATDFGHNAVVNAYLNLISTIHAPEDGTVY